MKFYLFVNNINSFGGELMALVSDLSRSNLELAPGFVEWKARFVATVTRTQYLSILERKKQRIMMECCQVDYQSLSLDLADLLRLQSVSKSYFTAPENDEELVDSDSDSSSSDDSEDLEDTGEDVDFDVMEVHISEKAKVERFFEETCKCKLAEDEKPCSLTLTLDDFVDCQSNCSELSSTELDLVILGAIQCSLNCHESSTSGRAEKERQNKRMAYYYHGKRICMRTFLFLHCLQKNRFYSLVKHYRKNGF